MSSKLEEIIGHHFGKHALLDEALTHPSCNKAKAGQAFNYQRMEFLGDAVLSLAIARLLYEIFPRESEGELARRQAALVRGETLTEVARAWQLGEFIKVTESEAFAGGRNNPSNLEDVCEAIIGAVYLDAGYEIAEKLVLQHWTPMARAIKAPPKDAKTSLQEWAQARGKPLPAYTVLVTEGPSHQPRFTVQVSVEGHTPTQASGPSKRVAEQQAARTLLDELDKK